MQNFLNIAQKLWFSLLSQQSSNAKGQYELHSERVIFINPCIHIKVSTAHCPVIWISNQTMESISVIFLECHVLYVLHCKFVKLSRDSFHISPLPCIVPPRRVARFTNFASPQFAGSFSKWIFRHMYHVIWVLDTIICMVKISMAPISYWLEVFGSFFYHETLDLVPFLK